MIGYDGIPINEDILLDLQFSEGAGLVVRDQAKPHHQEIAQNDPGGGAFFWERALTEHERPFDNAFDWGFDSKLGIGVLRFYTAGGGGTDGVYLDLATADCVDLDFVADDYSVGMWVNIIDNTQSQILIGRYTLNSKGWEIYWTKTGGVDYLTQRHHHAGTLVGGNPRSGCYSTGWSGETWHFLGISREAGGEGQHYRNGVALTMVTGGLVDPETSNNDLTIGCRYTKDANWHRGQMQGLRVWGRALAAADWLTLFEQEKDYFGV